MTKKRVYELAKELGIDSKELISRLEKLGIAVKAASEHTRGHRSGENTGRVTIQ